jgi:molybdopterin-guanine dinucleotide biosynthesis protein A
VSEHGRSSRTASPLPIGAVLAGGLGRRIGGAKATVQLAGQPLIAYPLAAVRAVLAEVAIVAKPDTLLPTLDGVTVWIEEAPEHHPLTGIRAALELADGRPVLVCAADLPFITAAAVRQIATADPGTALAVIASHRGQTQPLLGCYQPEAAHALGPARPTEDRRLTEVINTLAPRLIELDDPDLLFNVNSPDDLLQAAAMLDARRLSRT